MPSLLVRQIFRIYRFFISPGLHLLYGAAYGCRFVPTCSNYSLEAIQNHGTSKGIFLTIRRILRCHPFAQAGYDPVPRGMTGSFNSHQKR